MQGHAELAAALAQLTEMAQVRQPDDAVLAEFLPRYYEELPESDVDDRKLEDVYAVAVAHLTLGRVREPGQTIAKVLSPDRDRHGWQSTHSVLLVVADDVPFMVDTVRMVLERHGLAIYLLVHPMLDVVRDADHRVAAWSGEAAEVEAWTQIELDRCDEAAGRALETEVTAAIAEVQGVVADFGEMRDRLRSLADLDPLVPWLADEHFVLLGAADYDRGSDGTLTLRDGTALGQLRSSSSLDPPGILSDEPVVIARTDAVSTVHRAERPLCLMLRPPGSGVEHRFVGLLGSTAYRSSVYDIPTVGARAHDVLELTGAEPSSYLGRAVRNVTETLPRDIVFELDRDTLAEIVVDIVGLQERQLVRVIDVPEPTGPWHTVLVYLPRSRFTGDLPDRVAALVDEAYGITVEGATSRGLETVIGQSSLARISLSVRPPDGHPAPDLDQLGNAIDEMSTSWGDRLLRCLVVERGEVEARRLHTEVARYLPPEYRQLVDPGSAAGDLDRIAEVLAPDGPELRSAFVHELHAPEDEWRFRVYRRDGEIALADLLPLLSHLGLSALDEHPIDVRTPAGRVHIYDIGVRLPPGVELGESQRDEVYNSFRALMAAEVEADAFNGLILRASVTVREVAVVRAYAKYLRQIGFAFSQSYIESTLLSQPVIVRQLVELFRVRFDPALTDRAAADGVRQQLLTSLDAVPSLDEDRICRAFLMLIEATVRTNAWRGRPEISFKFDPKKVADLPLPRPAHEIWVCGPAVEGVHLRGGAIARGGLRWSDRREDFRTEVLGLMKAQMTKNAVIVPVGAKGGFVVKNPPADRNALRDVGIDCYRKFIGGMLDITDNIVAGRIVHPPDTVLHDGDDPYLVVAADKGTATFSDIANEVSASYDFWLGDAFASGGSAGYDHKAMGITARGAWESVRRHASMLGKDADRDPISVVGVGDMSGDVFGNGMLISPNIRLLAAFDHRHIFIDPDPVPTEAHAERRRLFELARSSWADYDERLISAGGGVFGRDMKSLTLSDEARKALGIKDDAPMAPTEVISAILRAPVDLLWNGGIGTYVKASTESHTDVGDRANDVLRINGNEIRARMVGEGGNLGLTQLGRIEYDLNGGLIYTDAIDNSAGVDCSDHEVNLKILLDGLVTDGELTLKQRNTLLEEMTNEVGELVLDDNKSQTLALLIARKQSLPMVNVHARYITQLEAEGWLDRGLEFLPSDKQIAERQATGMGLCAPEFSVLMAYTKNANVAETIRSDLPDDPVLEKDLLRYFPTPLRERFGDAIARHRLRREIIATQVVNQMVNLSGISYDHRMTEETGSGVAEVTRGWVAAREIVGIDNLWDEIEAVPEQVQMQTRIELFLECRRMNERSSLWLLRHRHPPFDIGAAVEYFKSGMTELATGLGPCIKGRMGEVLASREASRLAAGVPESLAERSVVWGLLHIGFDLVELANANEISPIEAANAYWGVYAELDLLWLWDGIGALPRSDRWESQARSALRDDLLSALASLTGIVLRSSDGSVGTWTANNHRSVARVQAMYREIRRAEKLDVTNLSVALRQLRNLALTSVRPT
ncbi:MAG: NAD-glutamate dehydrogenase [Actinomycetota bacterium]|nr:NAD-glutamate dehydrogenase [Actinomycetota bacterium]